MGYGEFGGGGSVHWVTVPGGGGGVSNGIDPNPPKGADGKFGGGKFLIKVNGNNGQGLNSNELRISVEGKSIIASGYYEDVYRKVNGRWRFARRDTTFFHWVPIQQGWARPADKK